jgi:small subunit ribosomal protein S9
MAKTTQNPKPEAEETKTVAAKPAARPAKAVKKEEEVVVAPETAVVTAEAVEAVEDDSQETDASGKRKADKYYEAVGRRKTAIARVRLYTRGDKSFTVNGKPFGKYFVSAEFKNIVEAPLVKMNCTDRFRITTVVKGGGIIAQADALRHGITRALVLFNADFKKRLKKSGYLTRDPRMKERKKPGLKKARRAPQWAKR